MMSGVAGLGGGNPALCGPAEPRLVRAAHEFEAQMMKELLRPMTASGSLTGEDGGDGGGTGTLGEFASESLAGALSAGGGFGMAHRILGELSRCGHDSEDGTGRQKFGIDSGISTRK
jgi:Rod binding domain-containing protein